MELIVFGIILIGSNACTAVIAFKAVQMGLNWNKSLSEGKKAELKGPVQKIVDKVEERKEETEIHKAVQAQHQAMVDWIGHPDYIEAYKEKGEEE